MKWRLDSRYCCALNVWLFISEDIRKLAGLELQLQTDIRELKVQQGVMAEGGGTTISFKTVQEIVEFDPDPDHPDISPCLI